MLCANVVKAHLQIKISNALILPQSNSLISTFKSKNHWDKLYLAKYLQFRGTGEIFQPRILLNVVIYLPIQGTPCEGMLKSSVKLFLHPKLKETGPIRRTEQVRSRCRMNF